MSEVSLSSMKKAAEKVRDDTTEEGNWPLIYPMAMDVLASSPSLMLRLIAALPPLAQQDER